MKKTIRKTVFETNSSTMHTLTVFTPRQFKNHIKDVPTNVNQIKTIPLMEVNEFHMNTHYGIDKKLSMVATNLLMQYACSVDNNKMDIVFDDKKELYISLINSIVDLINEKFKTKIKFDFSLLDDDVFRYDWYLISNDDGEGPFFDYSNIIYRTVDNLTHRMPAGERLMHYCLGRSEDELEYYEEHNSCEPYSFKLQDVQDLYELIIDNNVVFTVYRT